MVKLIVNSELNEIKISKMSINFLFAFWKWKQVLVSKWTAKIKKLTGAILSTLAKMLPKYNFSLNC